MDEKIIDLIVGRVCFRNWVQRVIDLITVVVLCVNLLLIIGLGVWFCLGKPFLCPLIFVTIINLLAVCFGVIIAIFSSAQKIKSAIQIDQYYKLKDRVLTAIQICNRYEITPMKQFQLEDTANYISTVDPAKVVRYRLGIKIIPAIFFVLASYGCGFMLMFGASLPANYTNSDSVQNSTADKIKTTNDIIQKTVADIRGNNNANPSAQNRQTLERIDLSDDLRQINERLRVEVERGVQRLADSATLADSISALSEIEQSVKHAATDLDAQSYNLSFQAMAKAFDNGGILRDAAAAIKNGNYDKAAAAIESVASEDFNNMNTVERNSVSAGLSDAADEMRRRNQNELEQLTRKLANEIDYRQKENSALTEQIAQKYRQQFARNNLLTELTRQLDEIAQHKARLIDAYNDELKSSDGGMFAAGQNNIDNSSNQKSNNNASNIAGNNIGDEPQGREVDETDERAVLSDDSAVKINLAGSNAEDKNVVELVEVIPDLGTVRVGGYEYQNLYLQYHKQMETVLEIEPIPFGHRRIIRRYFDSIKPKN
ncbi:MAG: hypothetical protein LBJ00_07855 [Planctomycetaceae bacterium]|nr:hypothetical protein [Planctomycetaceae bacterium]